jgi:hypothetical protein
MKFLGLNAADYSNEGDVGYSGEGRTKNVQKTPDNFLVMATG